MQWSLLVLIVMGQCSSIGGQLYDYHFIGENKTWKEAQEYCRKNHTDLATVSNQTDMKRLLNSTTARYADGAWIGLQENTTNIVWRWSQPRVEFNKSESNWYQGQPNNVDDQEICVRMNGGTWDDDSCSNSYEFICYDENRKSGKTFFISHNKMNWPEAQRFCKENYTDLISGVKQLEDFKTQRQNDAEPFWIGLFRHCWSWSDGSSFSFRSWDKGQPEKTGAVTTSNKKCATTTLDGKWSSDDCDNKKPFFCNCQSSSIGGQLCDYHFIGEKKTWKEAQEYCRKNHTDLATVANQTDMKRLHYNLLYPAGAWIGLHDKTPNFVWRWSQSGVEFKESESEWSPGQLNNVGDQENCVRMKNDIWDDDSCTTTYKFICYDEHKKTGKTFYISDDKKTWLDAQRFCREQYTDLISGVQQIEDFETQRQNEAEPFWIGLFRDSFWSWSDGSSFSFRSWDQGQPEKTCAMTTSDGKWSSDDCNKTKPFFCYNDSVILINQSMIWEDALYYCRHHHGDLVSITNQDDQRWVQERAKMASTPHVWMGLRYTCTLDFWFWVSDETVHYKNWALPQSGNDCNMSGAMDRNGTWVKLIDDDHQLNFICSK
ncbi:hypothetical protein PFLUV_G00105530 [Perca fluviatilis]|uniref:C-type lectin domain-containing protein n=1 Tax=Perca fluviatilis TaxID=8168 RepID=A0A6A5ET29_PERFL|nr:hypothetical protein PFLUV_G00105530 [Perca fluviatilis]